CAPARTPSETRPTDPPPRPASGYDQEMIGRFQCHVDRFTAVADHRALADIGPFAAAHARALIQKLGDIALGPAGGLDRLAQLLRDHHGVIAAIDRKVAFVSSHLPGTPFQNFPRARHPPPSYFPPLPARPAPPPPP